MFFNFVTTNNAYIHESNFAKFRVVPRNVLVPQGHLIVKRENFHVFEASCYRATVTTCIKNVNIFQQTIYTILHKYSVLRKIARAPLTVTKEAK